MPTTRETLKFTDPRTGKIYVMRSSGDKTVDKELRQQLRAVMEYDYQQTLPPEQRTVANQPTDFKCPHCKTKEEPVIRKTSITHGFLFFSSTEIISVYRCLRCSNEFTQQELELERSVVQQNNAIGLALEQVHEGIISKEQFDGIMKDYLTT